MPNKKNITSPAAAVTGSKLAVQGAASHTIETLKAAASAVTNSKPDMLADAIKAEVGQHLAGLVPKAPGKEPDICSNAKSAITPFCQAQKLGHDQADWNFESSMETAHADYQTALRTWQRAQSTYDFLIAQAEAALKQAVTAAVGSYQGRSKGDSRGREWSSYYTMKAAIADGVGAYQSSATAAAATLADAAGTLIAANQTYCSAIGAVQSQRLIDDAIVDQTFWQGVEGVLRAV